MARLLKSVDPRMLVALLVVVAVAALRWCYCELLPVNTGDILRHLLTGQAVLEHGFSSVRLPLRALDPAALHVAWSEMPYNYPPVTLLFFTLLAWLGSTLHGAKIVLTLMEAGSAVLVAKITGSRVLGVAYWALPTSIWWASREAQIEPLQSLITFAAILMLQRNNFIAAWALFALAIQAKLSAIVLLPIFVVRSLRNPGALILGAVLGSIPGILLQTQYDVLRQGMLYGLSMMTGSVPQRYNPYWFNPFDRPYWSWHPQWLIWWLHLVTPLSIVYFLQRAYREKSINALPVAAFLVALQLSTQGQFWYIMLIPSLIMPITDRRTLFVGFLFAVVLDPISLTEMIWGPWGYTVGNYYAINGVR